MKKNLKLISWNVNGIRAIQRKGFFKWFNKESPDILCIQETKAQEDQLPFDLRLVTNYHVYFSDAKKKGYSGVALYSRIKPLNVKFGFGIDKYDSEGRIIIAEYKEFVLFNIYFPNGKRSKERLKYKMDFYKEFLKILKELLKRKKRIIVCGDLNTAHKEIDLSRPKENEKASGFLPKERAWIDKFIKAGFLDTLRVFKKEPDLYSWWSMRTSARERIVGWRLDYFFVSRNLKKNLKRAFILKDVMGSDHCPVGIEISKKNKV